MGGSELSRIQEAFESNYIAPLGPMVDAFEHDFRKRIGMFSALFNSFFSGNPTM